MVKPEFILIKNISLNFGVQGFLLLLSFISIPYIVKHLGYEQYGIYILLTTFIGYINILNNGITSAVIKYSSEYVARNDRRIISKYLSNGFVLNIITGFTGSILLMVGGLFFVQSFHVISNDSLQSFTSLLFISSVSIFFLLIGDSFWSLTVAMQKFELANIKDLILGGIQTLGSLVIISNGGELKELVLFKLLIFIIYLILFFTISTRLATLNFKYIQPSTLLKIIRFGIKKFISDLTGQLIFQSDKSFISVYFPLTVLPFYTVPLSLVQRATFFIMNISPAIFPFFSFIARKENHLRDKYKKLSKIVNIVITPVFLYIYFFSDYILRIWMGPTFATQSSLVLKLLSLSYLIFNYAAIPTTLLESKGKPHIPAVFSSITALLQILLFVYLIPRYGPIGAAISLLISSSLMVSIFLIYMVKREGLLSLSLFWRNYFIPIIISIIIFGPLSFILLNITSSHLLAVSHILILILSPIVYFPLLFYCNVISKKEVETFLKLIKSNPFISQRKDKNIEIS